MDLIIWMLNNLSHVEKEFRNYIKRRAAPMRDRVNVILMSGPLFTTDAPSYEHRNPIINLRLSNRNPYINNTVF